MTTVWFSMLLSPQVGLFQPLTPKFDAKLPLPKLPSNQDALQDVIQNIDHDIKLFEEWLDEAQKRGDSESNECKKLRRIIDNLKKLRDLSKK